MIKEISGIDSITITTSYSDEELAETFNLDYYLERDLIRPVKTEKDKWIEKAIGAIKDEYTSCGNAQKENLNLEESKRQLAAIYDAGLAKI